MKYFVFSRDSTKTIIFLPINLNGHGKIHIEKFATKKYFIAYFLVAK